MKKAKWFGWGFKVVALLAAAGMLTAMLPVAALAADIVTFDEDTEVSLSGSGIDLLILSGSQADEVEVDETTVYVDVDAGDTFTLRSPNRNELVNDGGLDECAKSGSYYQVTVTGPDIVTFTPGASLCSSGGGGGGVPATPTVSTTPDVELTYPEGGETFVAGSEVSIDWTTSGSSLDTVKLEYSTDEGLSYNVIVDNVDYDESPYLWTLPDIDVEKVKLKITVQDGGKAYLDIDYSGYFEITTEEETTDEADEETSEEQPSNMDEFPDGVNVAPTTGETGPSPVDGTTEDISQVEAGQFVRSPSFSTVYYVTADLTRRPFWDGTTFFTWADSWDEVVWVTDATMQTLPSGDPMLPKPGVVTVKIQSVPDVFWIEMNNDGDYELRWISSEEIAIDMMGEAWADYVIDVEPTLMNWYLEGEDVVYAFEVDMSIMKTRAEIAALLQ